MLHVELIDMIFPDDIVTTGGALYKVLKCNPANYRVLDEDGKTWNLRRTPSVKKAPAGTPFAASLPEVSPGMAVRFTGRAAAKFPGIFVVTKADGGRGTFVQLGGGVTVTGSLSGVDPADEINSFGK